ncbi:MAG: hypothetical protein ACYCPD_00660 [Acidobacteriaceae bacterium]
MANLSRSLLRAASNTIAAQEKYVIATASVPDSAPASAFVECDRGLGQISAGTMNHPEDTVVRG